jgi:hypothetical protein
VPEADLTALNATSTVPLEADISYQADHVRFVPEAKCAAIFSRPTVIRENGIDPGGRS